MINIVRETISRHSMLSRGSCVAVGLSGGADSVSLLSVLFELADELKLTVRAIHINHGIRGASADRDEQFCRKLCDSLGIELDCFTLDIPAIAAERGIGLEQCGRECRYECFDTIARQYNCQIATAHTLSDSTETVIFNLTRGSGIAGARGIPAVRGNIIRPLIDVTRAQVEEYCRIHELDYVTDETNADTAYSRNLIRQAVIPTLERINPSMHRAFSRFTRCAQEDNACLDLLASRAADDAAADGGWSAESIAALPPALMKRVIAVIAGTHSVIPEFSQVDMCVDCIKRGFGAVVLRKDTRFIVSGGIIRIDNNRSPISAERWCIPVNPNGTLLPDGRTLSFTQIDLSVTDTTRKNHKLLFKNALSCDIITFNTSVRNRREGDRFAPVGRGVNKLLKKLFCDEGVPSERRESIAILASEQGILWVEGFGASELGKPRHGDRTVLIPKLSGIENMTEDN